MLYRIGFIILFLGFLIPSVSAQTSPSISNITDNRSSYNNSQIPTYKKFEITFDVNTNASHPIFPFDPNPPAGARPSDGITGASVDAIFTDPSGTTYNQPAFYLEEYEYQVKNGSDWLYPSGNRRWKIRFAPHKAGTWKYVIKAQDSTGTTTSPEQTFIVAPSQNHGFLRVSKTDVRYFEFDDGTYFPGLGYNENYRGIDWVNPVQGNQNKFQSMSANGIQFIRIWLSQWAIYGKEWSPWRGHIGGGYFTADSLTTTEHTPQHEVSMYIDGTNTCMLWGWETYPISLKRNKSYKVDVIYKTAGLARTNASINNFGLVVKLGGWLWDGNNCYNPGVGTVITPYSQADTGGNWVTLTGTFSSNNSDFLGNLYLATENVSAGIVHIDSVTIREDLGGGNYGPNIVPKPHFDHHEQIDMRNAAAFDKALELAEANGVYLRPVLLEKNDDIFNRMDRLTGQLTAQPSNDNFYGIWGDSTRKVRWLHKAWWRYAQARWGYSTAIHSWELLNEGDPYNGNHYDQADTMGKYLRCDVFGVTSNCSPTYQHPNGHMSSTSFWTEFPVDSFWANLPVKYPGKNLSNPFPFIDFADIHEYLDPGTNDFRIDEYNSTFTTINGNTITLPGNLINDGALASEIVSRNIGAKQPRGPRKPLVRGETGICNFDCGILNGNAANSLKWFHAFVWSQINSGGLYDASYWYTNHLYGGGFDNRPQFKYYYDFIKTVPLNNGKYVDIAASTSNTNLRVMGQKDTVNGNAHLWVQNNGNIVGTNPPAQSGTITISGFQNNKQYTLETWNTYQPFAAGTNPQTSQITSSGTGTLTLTVTNLTTDTAFKIINPNGPVPTGNLSPTPAYRTGDVNRDGSVNVNDLLLLLSRFGKMGQQGNNEDINKDGTVNSLDITYGLVQFEGVALSSAFDITQEVREASTTAGKINSSDSALIIHYYE